MKFIHLIASAAILACASLAWFILGGLLTHRTDSFANDLAKEVSGVWGPPITQIHPEAWFDSPNVPGGRAQLLPSSSKIHVSLSSEPKKRGLLWHRTFFNRFEADYEFRNPTRIPQTIYVRFPLPEDSTGLHDFTFRLGGEAATSQLPASSGQAIIRAIQLPPSGSTTLHAAYSTRGTDTWRYQFPNPRRISNFNLTLQTDFEAIDFPSGTGSPSSRSRKENGYLLSWNYPDVLSAPAIGMEMPKCLNAGPIASRIAFFAPVSLCFFVTVLLLMGSLRGIPLHPMHVFFISCGFFAFHLLFAYLVDLLPLTWSFATATIASLVLVCGYLGRLGGKTLLAISAPAQVVYLVAFSASFMIDGLTGISITLLAILTLALLMFITAKTDWQSHFALPHKRNQSSGTIPAGS